MFWNSLSIGVFAPFQLELDKLIQLDKFMMYVSRDYLTKNLTTSYSWFSKPYIFITAVHGFIPLLKEPH